MYLRTFVHTIIQYIRPSHLMISTLHFHIGGEQRIGLGAVLQQPDALPSELLRTLNFNIYLFLFVYYNVGYKKRHVLLTI